MTDSAHERAKLPATLDDALDRLADALAEDDAAGEPHGEVASLVIAWLEERGAR